MLKEGIKLSEVMGTTKRILVHRVYVRNYSSARQGMGSGSLGVGSGCDSLYGHHDQRLVHTQFLILGTCTMGAYEIMAYRDDPYNTAEMIPFI